MHFLFFIDVLFQSALEKAAEQVKKQFLIQVANNVFIYCLGNFDRAIAGKTHIFCYSFIFAVRLLWKHILLLCRSNLLS